MNYYRNVTIAICLFYIALGFISLFCNMLNLFIWMSSRELRRKYLYLMALDVCELVDAISYILTGIGRIMALLENNLWKPTSIRECFFKTYWPHSLILGTQLPSFAIILISCERLLAVLRPIHYVRLFKGYSRLALLSLVPLAGLVSLTIGGLSTTGKAGDTRISSHFCTIFNSTAFWYSMFHYIFIVFAHSLSFITIFVIRKISKKHSRRKVNGDDRFGAMLVITGSFLILLGSEPLAQLLIRWSIARLGIVVLAVVHIMPGCLSIVNTIINFIFRPEFRNQFLILIRLKRSTFHVSNVVSVRPMMTVYSRPLYTMTNY